MYSTLMYIIWTEEISFLKAPNPLSLLTKGESVLLRLLFFFLSAEALHQLFKTKEAYHIGGKKKKKSSRSKGGPAAFNLKSLK